MPYYYGIMHKHKRIKERAPHMLQQKKNKGFTIIEVLIVLAIAGLIMLVVFLAVPALQRSSRNNARDADASRIAAAVNECMSNNGGKIASCDTGSELANYIDISSNQQLIGTTTSPIGAAETDASISKAALIVGSQCNANNNGVTTTGVSARSYAIVWLNETNSTSNTAKKCTQ